MSGSDDNEPGDSVRVRKLLTRIFHGPPAALGVSSEWRPARVPAALDAARSRLLASALPGQCAAEVAWQVGPSG